MNRMVRVLLLITVAGLLPRTIASSSEGRRSDWAPLEYLLGDWVGEGGGQPGQGIGILISSWFAEPHFGTKELRCLSAYQRPSCISA